jgi:DNA-binding beta-propeller fold protein YncE
MYGCISWLATGQAYAGTTRSIRQRQIFSKAQEVLVQVRKKLHLEILAISITLAFVVAIVAVAAPVPQASGYKLTKKVVLGGDTGWDYLLADAATHRIFISHGNHTIVTDADGKLLGDIQNTAGVHGIALAPEFNRGFTSNGQGNSVTVFDLKSLATITEIKIPGQNPDAIIYDPASKRVFTMNGRSSDATAIDAKTGDIVGSVPLGGRPETAQVDNNGHMYVNIEDKNQLLDIDTKALKVLNTWSLSPCDAPSGQAIDVAHKRTFIGCGDSNTMIMVDITNGKTVATVPIGKGVDANGFDPTTGFAFASTGDGFLTVAHEDSPDKMTLVENVPTQARARTMTVDTSTHTVYSVTAEYGPPPAAPPAGTPPGRGGRAPMVPGSFTLLIIARQ